MSKRAMLLINCTQCDDVVKLVDNGRGCECGKAYGRMRDEEPQVTGPARVLSIAWETYDGLTEGSLGAIGVLPRAQYRAKGDV